MQAAIAGDVIPCRSPDYESARKPSIARFHHPSSGCRAVPSATATCGDDLVRAADRADDRDPQRRALLRGPLLERRHRDRRLAAERGLGVGQVATIGAGARLGDVYDSLSPHALTIPAGSCPSIGIAGPTLGAGSRSLAEYGLTSDQLLAARVVLASGRVVGATSTATGAVLGAARAGRTGSSWSPRSSSRPGLPCRRRHFNLAWPAPARRFGDRRLAGLGTCRRRRALRQPVADRGGRGRYRRPSSALRLDARQRTRRCRVARRARRPRRRRPDT